MTEKDVKNKIIKSLKSKNYEKFISEYEEMRKDAMKDEKIFLILKKQLEEVDYESLTAQWQKAFVSCGDFISLCATLKGATEDDAKEKKIQIAEKIIDLLQKNMEIFELDSSENERESRLLLKVCLDVMSVFAPEGEKCTYLAILWELLGKIEKDPRAKAFYGERVRDMVLNRSAQNLKESASDIQYEQMKSILKEDKEYVRAFRNALPQIKDEKPEKEEGLEPKSKKKQANKGKSSVLEKILLIAIITLLTGTGFLAGIAISNIKNAAENVKLLSDYNVLLSEKQTLEEKYDSVLQEKEELEKKLKEALGESSIDNQDAENQNTESQGAQGQEAGENTNNSENSEGEGNTTSQEGTSENTENVIELTQVCELRKSPSKTSEMLMQLSKGAEVTVIDELNNGWLKVRFNRNEGYIQYSVNE